MKKMIVILLLLTFCSTYLAGCAGKQTESASKREIPTSESSSAAAEGSETDVTANQSSAAEAPANEGTITSLDELKKNSEAAGYKTDKLQDMQKNMGEGFVDGFNVIIGSSYIPVAEFKSSKESQQFADMINKSGYSVAIVNGKFLTFTSATQGIVKDEEQLKALEGIMDAKAQVQESAPATEAVSADTTDYKSTYTLIDGIGTSMNNLLNRSLAKNNKAVPENDPQSTSDLSPFMFNPIPLCYTNAFCEDPLMIDATISAIEMLGITEAKVTRNAEHNYTISGKEAGTNTPFEINGIYTPTSKSLRMVEKKDGKVDSFFEFIPLGDNKYAFQTNKERAIVVYKDGKVLSFTYSMLAEAPYYDSESDSIYPAGKGADDSWISQKGEDNYQEFYSFNGTTIRINADGINRRVKVEIPQ
ncbi:MAG TPA: hypothetical protein VHT96_14305 [Clostridia bacterium]|nr:hypothetical protein [Clostridia bacterium]